MHLIEHFEMEPSTSSSDVTEETSARENLPNWEKENKNSLLKHLDDRRSVDGCQFTSISNEDYLKERKLEGASSLHILDSSYRDCPANTSVLGHDSTNSYSIYRSSHRRPQTLVFHHSDYPTRNLECLNTSPFQTGDIRVEWSYCTRDFRAGGAGVLGDLMYPYSTHDSDCNRVTVAPSYQQIRGVGYERSRDWAGRPLIKCVFKVDLGLVGKVALALTIPLSIAFIPFIGSLNRNSSLTIAAIILTLLIIATVSFLVDSYRRCTSPESDVTTEDTATQNLRRYERSMGDYIVECPSSRLERSASMDLPPPYEAPPDYNTLAPEILMNASTLPVHRKTVPPPTDSSAVNPIPRTEERGGGVTVAIEQNDEVKETIIQIDSKTTNDENFQVPNTKNIEIEPKVNESEPSIVKKEVVSRYSQSERCDCSNLNITDVTEHNQSIEATSEHLQQDSVHNSKVTDV